MPSLRPRDKHLDGRESDMGTPLNVHGSNPFGDDRKPKFVMSPLLERQTRTGAPDTGGIMMSPLAADLNYLAENPAEIPAAVRSYRRMSSFLINDQLNDQPERLSGLPRLSVDPVAMGMESGAMEMKSLSRSVQQRAPSNSVVYEASEAGSEQLPTGPVRVYAVNVNDLAPRHPFHFRTAVAVQDLDAHIKALQATNSTQRELQGVVVAAAKFNGSQEAALLDSSRSRNRSVKRDSAFVLAPA